MKDFLTLLTSSSWLMDETTLQSIVAAYPDFNSIKTASFVKDFQKEEMEISDSLAIIQIVGPLFTRPNFITEMLGIGTLFSQISNDLKKARMDSSINRILLYMDTPGGQVAQTNETAILIKKIAEEKPVDVFVGGSGLSAGYWLASGASNIYLDATAGVGSIGVKAVASKPMNNDYEMEIVSSQSPNKSPDPTTKEGYEAIQSVLDDVASVFIEAVASNRGVSTKTVINDFGKGGIVIGQKAVDIGMADKVVTFDEVLEMSAKKMKFNGGKKMDLNTLKSEHKGLYDQIVQEAQASLSDSISAKEVQIVDLSSQVSARDEEIEALKAEKTGLDVRTKALEKAEAIRAQKELEYTASGIFDAALASSSIPENLHVKVKKQVDHNKFIGQDGVFNSEGFKETIKAEISEWETSLGSVSDFTGFVAGNPVSNSRNVAGGNVSNIGDADQALARMRSHLGITTQ